MDRQQRRVILGGVLAAARASAGLSQVQLAARLAKPQSFVSKCESGERRVEVVDLDDIASALGVTPLALWTSYQEALHAR